MQTAFWHIMWVSVCITWLYLCLWSHRQGSSASLIMQLKKPHSPSIGIQFWMSDILPATLSMLAYGVMGSRGPVHLLPMLSSGAFSGECCSSRLVWVLLGHLLFLVSLFVSVLHSECFLLNLFQFVNIFSSGFNLLFNLYLIYSLTGLFLVTVFFSWEFVFGLFFS